MTGKRFGNLVVSERSENDKNHKARWLCRCDCGRETIVIGSNLMSGKTSSCGCVVSPDLTDNRYGRLTVLRRDKSSSYHSAWVCKCDCGMETVVSATNLKQGKTKSCGCLHRDAIREAISTHGESHSRLHVIWSGMKERCFNQNASNYHNYGGRGITVCDEWRSNYVAFRNWALENGYADNLSIDRINVNGNYEPNNCRWATSKEQNNNKRNSKTKLFNA